MSTPANDTTMPRRRRKPVYGPTPLEQQPAWVRRELELHQSPSLGKESTKMSTIVDQYGRPYDSGGDVQYGPERHPYGPVRWEHQPKEARAHGRKGKALSGRRGGRKSSRKSRRSSSGGSSRADYAHYKRARKKTFGPMPMSDQPAWVRRAYGDSGAKSRSWSDYWGSRKSRRKGRKGSRRSSSRRSGDSRRSLRRAGYSRKQVRQLMSARRSKGSRGSRRSSRSMARSGKGRVLRLSGLYKHLARTGDKAWVCVGPTRTGCGGGRKGGRGSRVFGVLRP